MIDGSILIIDGSRGEGGGQVLRTCLSLSALTGRPFRLENIRAGRARPGLRPQHLTAARAAATVCRAELVGDALDSTVLEFTPTARPRQGAYTFDVMTAAQGGSAGAATLIFQTVLWPLLFAGGASQLTLRGGTHVPFSPPYHYLAHVFRPVVGAMGATFSTELDAWGWYPAGRGAFRATISPVTALRSIPLIHVPPGRVEGVAAVTNLPADIPQRMAGRATNLLEAAGLKSRVDPLRERGAGPGAGIFLWVPQAGFSSLGRKGLPSDKVAEAAVADLLAFVDNTVAVDAHLADQILLPLALAEGRTRYTTDRLTLHTLTNADLLRRWLDVTILVTGELEGPAEIDVKGIGFTAG